MSQQGSRSDLFNIVEEIPPRLNRFLQVTLFFVTTSCFTTWASTRSITPMTSKMTTMTSTLALAALAPGLFAGSEFTKFARSLENHR